MPNPSIQNDRRLEVLLKKEMVEHQAIISSHHKEMQELRDALSLAMQRFDSLFEHCEMLTKDMSLFYNQQIHYLKEKAVVNDLRLDCQQNTLISFHQQLQELHNTFSLKSELEKSKKELESQIKESGMSHISSFQNLQQELKSLFQRLEKEFSELKSDITKKVNEFDEKVETKFSLSKLDKEAVLNELRVYKKGMFIIEKKIENLYTLIERINKRSAVSCLKPE